MGHTTHGYGPFGADGAAMRIFSIIRPGLVATLLVLASCATTPSVPAEEAKAATTTSAPVTAPTITSSTSVAPPRSVVEPIEENSKLSTGLAPEALAFTSTDDVGRIYETRTVTGVLALSTQPGSSFSGNTVDDATVVRVITVDDRSGQHWVELALPFGEPLGWALAADLIETEQVLVDRPWELRRRFHTIVDTGTPAEILAEADPESDVVGEPNVFALLFSPGDRALSPSGDTYVEVADPITTEPIGWILESRLARVTTHVARNADGSTAFSSYPGGFDAGVATAPPVIVSGCGIFSATIATTGSDTFGSHLIYGTSAPSAVWDGAAENVRWSLGPDQRSVFIRPADSVTLHLPAASPVTWWFLDLGPENDAPWIIDADGAPVLDASGNLTALSPRSITADPGTCTAAP
ncbi:MAG: hypothetical protein ACR2P0_12015 [Acidimicrobiales bacterium]